jgi:pimeloyl-ACP methyl ester carboxylesterase
MNLQHRWVDVNGVGLHAVVAGDGPPVVLLHGWPVTWYHWRGVISFLAHRHLVIAPDLRGLGDSDRPGHGYDKRSLAADVVALADHLGIGRFAVAGHDFGGSVGYAIAAAHRDRVTHLIVEEELLPGFPVPPSLVHRRYPRWHNAFHSALDVPEMLIAGHEREYLNLFWSLTSPGNPMPASAIAEYSRTYLNPGTLRAGLAYYRAGPADAEHNRRSAQSVLAIPTLAVGGDGAMATAVQRSVEQVAADVTGVVLDNCGHYPAQEQPRRVGLLIADFIADLRSTVPSG